MHANEIETTLKEYGYERGTRACLMRIAEELEGIKQSQREIEKMIITVAEVSTLQNAAMDGMKQTLDRFKKQDDDPRSTQEMITS